MTIHATTPAVTTVDVPGYVPGTWEIDPVHSDVSFTARHLVSKVLGRFGAVEGEIHAAESPLDSSVAVTVDAASVDTNNQQRDAHLRSPDFLDVDTYPTLSFTSTAVRSHGEHFLVEGDLTIKDVTRRVTAALEVGGFTSDQDGNLRAGYTARFEINRKDYNVNFHWVLETGGVMVGDRVAIQLEIEAILQPTRDARTSVSA